MLNNRRDEDQDLLAMSPTVISSMVAGIPYIQ